MHNNKINSIRLEQPRERRKVENLVREAFGNVYSHGCLEHYAMIGIRYHGLQEGDDSSSFLCKELISGYIDGVEGEYTPPRGYYMDGAKAEEFDRLFPEKVKLVLPGQLW